MLGENSSTLRFWEKEFSWLRPVKNGRGDRRYVEGDIELLRRIQFLTREAGYTIDGAREQLRRERHLPDADASREQLARTLREVRKVLVEIAGQL